MSSYQIQSTDEALPALSLPPGTRPVSHPDYEHDVEVYPPEIEPIEHRLRVDFIDGGPVTLHELHGPGQPLARRYADRTLTDTYHAERRCYATFPDDEQLGDAPAFLHAELSPHYEELRAICQRRLRWYTEHIPTNLNKILETVESLYPETGTNAFDDVNGWVGTVIVSDEMFTDTYATEHGLNEQYVVHEGDLDDHTSPSEYGISLPAPLLVGEYNSRSRYSLIPWSDGLVCSCPYKQQRPSRVMCKHELAASAPDKPAIFVGQDLDPLCARMTGINLALHGIPGYAVHGDSLTDEAMAAWRIDHSQSGDGVIHTADPDWVAFGPKTDIDDTSGSDHGRQRGNGTVDTSSNSTTDPDTPRQIDFADFRF